MYEDDPSASSPILLPDIIGKRIEDSINLLHGFYDKPSKITVPNPDDPDNEQARTRLNVIDAILKGYFGIEQKRLMASVIQSYPRALYELGFFKGDTSLVKRAYELSDLTTDQLLPVPNVRTRILTEKDDQSPVEVNTLAYEVHPEYFEWQVWRDLTIRNKDYTQDQFPPFLQITGENDTVHSNMRFSKDERVDLGELVVTIEGIKANANDHEFRFTYRVSY